MQRRTLLHSLLSLPALLVLGACEQGPSFNTTDVTGASYGPALRLKDQHGQARTLADFRGKVVAIFFGYTNCPDVCPTSLMMLKEALQLMSPAEAERVQVLFVSVDPARDTPERLTMYMNAFDPRFLALTGTDAEIAAVAKEFKVYYEKKGDIAGGRYTIDHSAGCYLFGPDGRARLFARHGETATRVAADLKLLLTQT